VDDLVGYHNFAGFKIKYISIPLFVICRVNVNENLLTKANLSSFSSKLQSLMYYAKAVSVNKITELPASVVQR